MSSSPPFQPMTTINNNFRDSSSSSLSSSPTRMASHPRCSSPQTSSITTGGVAVGGGSRSIYPQQHSLRIARPPPHTPTRKKSTTKTTATNSNPTIKPVLRKRNNHAFYADSINHRAKNGAGGGIYVPSWRKDGIKKREQLLQEDEENGGNDFVIDRRSNLKNYYAIAERVLDQFQITCASSTKLEETYLMGNRLIKFLSNILPNHRHYYNRDSTLSQLRIKSQNDLSEVRNRVDEVALLLDKEIYQEIMEMEGMEMVEGLDDSFCPSSTSNSRRTNRKRVTFDLQQPASPVAASSGRSLLIGADIVDTIDSRIENEGQQQGGGGDGRRKQHGSYSYKRFEWQEDDPLEKSSTNFTGRQQQQQQQQHPDTSTSTASPPISPTTNTALDDEELDDIMKSADAWTNDNNSWEQFGIDCGDEEWNHWPETNPVDAFVESSQQPLSFDEEQEALQQQKNRHGPAHLDDDGRDWYNGGGDDGKDGEIAFPNNVECASSSSRRSEHASLDNRLQQLNKNNDAIALHHSMNSSGNGGSKMMNHDAVDSWDQGSTSNTEEEGECGDTTMSSSDKGVYVRDSSMHIASSSISNNGGEHDDDEMTRSFETGALETKNPLPATGVPIDMLNAKPEKMGGLDIDTFQTETPILFPLDISTGEDSEDGVTTTNNVKLEVESDYRYSEQRSFDSSESDEELEHQEYVKKMTESEFGECDCSGVDLTIATAETEAMTVDDDSDSESSTRRRAVGGEDTNKSIGVQINLLKCKLKNLRQVNQEPAANKYGKSQSAAQSNTNDYLATTEGEEKKSTSLTNDQQPPYDTSSSKIDARSQNGIVVSTSVKKYQRKSPLRRRSRNVSNSERSPNHPSSPIPQASPNLQYQPSCNVDTREITSRSKNNLAANISEIKCPLQCKSENISVSESSVNSSSPSIKPQDQPQNNLAANVPTLKYQLKYPLKNSGRKSSVVSESCRSNSSSSSQQISLSSQEQSPCNIVSNKTPSMSPMRRRRRNVSVAENSMNRSSLKQQAYMESRGLTSCDTTLSEITSSVQDGMAVNVSEVKCAEENNSEITLQSRAQHVFVSEGSLNHSSSSFKQQASLKSRGQPSSDTASSEIASNSQDNLTVNASEVKYAEERDSETPSSTTQARRSKGARLKSLRKTVAWRRRYGNSTTTLK